MPRFSAVAGAGSASTAGERSHLFGHGGKRVNGLRRRLLLTTVVAFVVLLGITGTAFAGTVKVNLKAHSNYWGAVGSHRNTAQIIVYGPSGYYRSTTVAGQSSLGQIGTVSNTFTGAPMGPYRVRVYWAAGNGTGAQWAQDWYPSVGWWAWEQNPSRDFTSP
ncbi:MAG: hypothetical protein WCP21_17910 [Armatimonadota bacterium]